MNARQTMMAKSGALRVERLLPGPPERIWAYLTRPALLSTWLGEGEIQLHVGGYVELRFHRDQRQVPAANVAFSGVVTHCVAPESLAYHWVDFNSISNVIFEIEPRGPEVLLVITHAWSPKTCVPESSDGWDDRLDALEAQLRECGSGIFVAFGGREQARCES